MAAPIAQRFAVQIKPILLCTSRLSKEFNHVKSMTIHSKLMCANNSASRYFNSGKLGLMCQRSVGPETSTTIELSSRRAFSSGTGVTQQELKKKIDDLTDEFMETRDLLSDARESKGTVYFSDDLADATEAVKGTLKVYNALLEQLDSQQKQHVLRTIGLKMQELEAQLKMIEDELLE